MILTHSTEIFLVVSFIQTIKKRPTFWRPLEATGTEYNAVQ